MKTWRSIDGKIALMKAILIASLIPDQRRKL